LTWPFATLLRIHLFCALTATVVFWVTGFAPKGGRTHRVSGRLFSRLIYAAAWTGGVLAVAELAAPTMVHPPDPGVAADVAARAARANRQTMWLVLYVLLILVTPVQHGLAAVAAGASPLRVRSRIHATLNTLSMLGTLLMLGVAAAWHQWLFLVVVPIGFTVGLRNLSYASRTGATPVEWEREHLTSMITAGVTLHTAFFVFGSSRTLGWDLHGPAALLPWTIPAMVGLPLIIWLRARRRAN
jgi:hypothetical protein